jgi:hypothetical protein
MFLTSQKGGTPCKSAAVLQLVLFIPPYVPSYLVNSINEPYMSVHAFVNWCDRTVHLPSKPPDRFI